MTTSGIALVTGATGGLGQAIVQALATQGYHVVLACRDEQRAAQLMQDLPTHGCSSVHLDLASLVSTQKCAQELNKQLPRLDLLINNAGVMGGPHSLTEDGFEQNFGINHLGHFALTAQLKPLLLKSSTPKIIAITSSVHRFTALDLHAINGKQRYNPWRAYAQSKLANLLFITSLQQRLPASGLANAVHPGYIATELTQYVPLAGLGNKLLATTPEQAVTHVLYPLTQQCPGGYFGPPGWLGLAGKPSLLEPAKAAQSKQLAEQLWLASERLTGVRW